MVRQRRPRAVQVRGGLWMRPPRPRPLPIPPECEEGEEQQQGYESCNEGTPDILRESLVLAVQPAIRMLLRLGETDAASSVQALCDYTHTREEGHAKLQKAHIRLKTKLCDCQKKIAGKANLHGQTVRYWKQNQRLRRRLYLEKAKAHWRPSGRWLPP